ncbi:MAG: hypothetical protein MUD01_00720 [Chloroflexaceae bacterium]|nr:hypothetical protein [Chloroflexaceae bacterium]
MSHRTVTPMQPGQIATEAGADTLRGELLSAHAVRCGDLWFATASVYSDGAAEIELSCRYDAEGGQWASHAYFYSFERATTALREYEASGELPEGE